MSKSSRNILMPILSIMIVLLVIIGISFAYFTIRITGDEEVFLEVGTFEVYFEDEETITLNNAVPMSTEVGMSMPSYSFTVRNTGTIGAIYQLSLEQEDINLNTLNQEHIRFSIREENGEWSTPSLLSDLNNLQIIERSVLAQESERDYEIRLWLDEHAGNDAQGRTFKARLTLDAVQGNALLPDMTPPEIRLNGSSVINIEQHTPFVDPGVQSVTDDRDVLDIDDVETRYYFLDGTEIVPVAEINTSILGIYYIYYTISDRAGNEGLAIRTVNVYLPDRIPPVLTLLGDEVMTIGQYYDFVDPGVTAHDNIDGNITHRIVTIGTINTNIIGSQSIKYIITDQAGNTASVSRVVNVVERIYILDAWVSFWSMNHGTRETIFTRGYGIPPALREEFERNNLIFLNNGMITEEEYEELWKSFLSQRYRRVRPNMSEGYIEQIVLIDEDGITRQYVQSRSGVIHTPVDSSWLFAQHVGTMVNIENLRTNLTMDMSFMFSLWHHWPNRMELLDLSSWDVSNVTDVGMMFFDVHGIREINLSNWNLSNLTATTEMFYSIHGLEELNLSNWNTSNITDTSMMFSYLQNEGFTPINIKMDNWDTSNVTDMNWMFLWSDIEYLNLCSFNTMNVTNKGGMFYNMLMLREVLVNQSTWNSNVNNPRQPLFSGWTPIDSVTYC